jgi:putative DNA primase/helicase
MSEPPPYLRIVSAIDAAETLASPAPADSAHGSDDPGRDVPPAGSEAGGAGDGPEDANATGGKRGGADGEGQSLDMDCAWLPRTDLGNAQRFVRRHGGDFLFVPEWGWLAWDGKRWNAREADAILSRAVHQTIKDIAREADAMKASGLDVMIDDKKGIWISDKIRGWCLASQGNAHIACVARLAQAYLTASSDGFDADPMAMNVDNGTLRFARAEGGDYITFHPHRRADRMTKITPVIYDPQAQAPVYDRFLARVQPGERMQRHLHAWGGVSLTGAQIARLSFWYGTGRNGKSTLIDIWAHVMGDYSQTIPIESFLDQGRSRRGGEASPDIAALPGIRCLRTSEPEKGAKLAESLVKLVTGGEPLRARHLNRDFFEFRPAFKLTMQGNYKPRIDGTDEGIWARILLVPWTVMIPAEERDTALPAKLKDEAPGILNRLLDGLRDYLDNGLSPPDEVIEATAEYREDSDPVGRFLAECTLQMDPPPPGQPGDEYRVAGNEIFKLYIAWAKASGERPWSPRAFSRGLQDHGVQRLKSSGIWYRHIRLIRAPADFAGQEYEQIKDGT